MARDYAEIFEIHSLAKNYGWTPAQIGEIDDVTIQGLLILNDEIARQEERDMKAAQKKR